MYRILTHDIYDTRAAFLLLELTSQLRAVITGGTRNKLYTWRMKMKKIYTQKHIFKQQNKHGNTKEDHCSYVQAVQVRDLSSCEKKGLKKNSGF